MAQVLINTEQDGHIIETEQNPTPHHDEYPIVNYERDIDLQEDIDNGCERVENDQVPDYCPFIGNEGLNMNTTSRNLEDFSNNLFDDLLLLRHLKMAKICPKFADVNDFLTCLAIFRCLIGP